MVVRQNIGIVGLGYVGLPLALASCQVGHNILGIDRDFEKIASLNRSISYIEDVPSSALADPAIKDRLIFTTSFEEISKCSIVILCVPTPLTENLEPHLTFLEEATRKVSKYIQPGTLLISESTSYPGTLRNLIKPVIFENQNLKNSDILFAVAPERVDPGNKNFNHRNTPRVVGALGNDAKKKAIDFYKSFTSEVIEVSEPEIAEAAKLLENTFRQVNIALVNEFTQIAHAMNFDIREVIEAASSKPYGFMKFTPGPGVGGHCIPVDPYYLTWSARKSGFAPLFTEKANQVNRGMPIFVVDRVEKMMNSERTSCEVLVAGLAYKPGISDLRESPALEIIKILKNRGYPVSWYDPNIDTYHGAKRGDLDSQYSTVVITLPGMELPIENWLTNGVKIFDCTGYYQKFPEIEQL